MMTLRKLLVPILSVVLTSAAYSHVDHYVLDGPVSIDCPDNNSISIDFSKLSIDRSNQLATLDSTFNGTTSHMLFTLQNSPAGEVFKLVFKDPTSLSRQESTLYVTEIVSPSDKNVYINRYVSQDYNDDGSTDGAPMACKMNVHFRFVK